MTQFFACSNLKKHFSIGQEFCEIGIATINFASSFCELQTVNNKKMGVFKFENGITKFRKIETTELANNFTEIVFKPDKSIFADLNYTYTGILQKAENINSKFENLNITVYNEMI